MISADLIGWISNCCFVYGVLAIANKRISGFYFNLVGNILYIIVALMIGTPSLF